MAKRKFSQADESFAKKSVSHAKPATCTARQGGDFKIEDLAGCPVIAFCLSGLVGLQGPCGRPNLVFAGKSSMCQKAEAAVAEELVAFFDSLSEARPAA
ncbi:hypothetical protein LCM27_13580 [Ruegeria marisrubri]|uniref:hypothetical protein n=1 Tax=Ruegeria marisrubri TaxID=1685379 RepID=UPI001CD716E7|nr:hypothetical protein [Ruegeria marisrubri]MCA0907426.1 hypothetical protein [Ruegeria marisrubri]